VSGGDAPQGFVARRFSAKGRARVLGVVIGVVLSSDVARFDDDNVGFPGPRFVVTTVVRILLLRSASAFNSLMPAHVKAEPTHG
jgi:hypothetical protein